MYSSTCELSSTRRISTSPGKTSVTLLFFTLNKGAPSSLSSTAEARRGWISFTLAHASFTCSKAKRWVLVASTVTFMCSTKSDLPSHFVHQKYFCSANPRGRDQTGFSVFEAERPGHLTPRRRWGRLELVDVFQTGGGDVARFPLCHPLYLGSSGTLGQAGKGLISCHGNIPSFPFPGQGK